MVGLTALIFVINISLVKAPKETVVVDICDQPINKNTPLECLTPIPGCSDAPSNSSRACSNDMMDSFFYQAIAGANSKAAFYDLMDKYYMGDDGCSDNHYNDSSWGHKQSSSQAAYLFALKGYELQSGFNDYRKEQLKYIIQDAALECRFRENLICDEFTGYNSGTESCAEEYASYVALLAVIKNMYPELLDPLLDLSTDVNQLEEKYLNAALSPHSIDNLPAALAQEQIDYPSFPDPKVRLKVYKNGGESPVAAATTLIFLNNAVSTYVASGNPERIPPYYIDQNIIGLYQWIRSKSNSDDFSQTCHNSVGNLISCNDPGDLNAKAQNLPAGRLILNLFGNISTSPNEYDFIDFDLVKADGTRLLQSQSMIYDNYNYSLFGINDVAIAPLVNYSTGKPSQEFVAYVSGAGLYDWYYQDIPLEENCPHTFSSQYNYFPGEGNKLKIPAPESPDIRRCIGVYGINESSRFKTGPATAAVYLRNKPSSVTISPIETGIQSKANQLFTATAEDAAFYNWYHKDVPISSQCPKEYFEDDLQVLNGHSREAFTPPKKGEKRCLAVYAANSMSENAATVGPAVAEIILVEKGGPPNRLSLKPDKISISPGYSKTLSVSAENVSRFDWYAKDISESLECPDYYTEEDILKENGGNTMSIEPPSAGKRCVAVFATNDKNEWSGPVVTEVTVTRYL